MISSEVEQFARTGGLGDVVLGLSRALGEGGAEIVIVTPKYGISKVPGNPSWWAGTVPARVGWGPDDVHHLGVLETRISDRVRVCLLDHHVLFERQGIYGDTHGTFGDNELRFAALSRGALSVAEAIWGPVASEDGGPDVIHAHDWHASFAVLYARLAMGEAWRRVPTAITIHNLAFQGNLGFEALDRLAIPRDAYHHECLEHGGLVNLLKGAMSLADRITTVSPTYAREILSTDGGFGLASFLRSRSGKLLGIVNGIDPERFDPRTDAAIARNYGVDDAVSGRRACKEALFDELGLDGVDAPLFGIVSRLTWQKGIDLLLDALPVVVRRSGRVVLVGTGEPDLEHALWAASQRFPDQVVARIAFDERLARRVYAGADFFFVPSRYEPCGLTQLYAMRYGSVPIVTDVGGLHDTVVPYNPAHDAGTGFVASEPSVTSLAIACEDALATYWDDRRAFRDLGARALRRDSSWQRSAEEYVHRVYLPIIPPHRGCR